jgi:hypothetical protein
MKRRIFTVLFSLLLILLLSTFASAIVDWCNGSGAKTAAGLIVQGTGQFHGVMVTTDGTNTVTLDVYDAVIASGTKLITTQIIPSSATNRVFAVGVSPPVKFSKGIYVNSSVAGGGSYSYIVYFN